MSEKFEPVEVKAEAATSSEVSNHLDAFIRRFVMPRRRSRARHILLEEPDKAVSELRQLGMWLDPRYAAELTGSQGFPGPLARRFGATRGVYFDQTGEMLRATAAEAATLSAFQDRDVILSFKAGALVLVILNEGGSYMCSAA